MDMNEDDTFECLKYRVEIGPSGTRRYYNTKGQLHREGGPAVEFTDGSTQWWVNGLRHRDDGPAVVWADGHTMWYTYGRPHSYQ